MRNQKDQALLGIDEEKLISMPASQLIFRISTVKSLKKVNTAEIQNENVTMDTHRYQNNTGRLGYQSESQSATRPPGPVDLS